MVAGGQSSENRYWLCVVTSKNLDVIERAHIYGIPYNAKNLRLLSQFQKGDKILFYVVSPVMKILGKSTVSTEMFEEKTQLPWTDRLYPLRVRVGKMDPVLIRSKDFLGKISTVGKRIPMGSSIIPITKEDYEIMMDISKK